MPFKSMGHQSMTCLARLSFPFSICLIVSRMSSSKLSVSGKSPRAPAPNAWRTATLFLLAGKASGLAAPCASSNLVVWKSGARRGLFASDAAGSVGCDLVLHNRANPTLPGTISA